jgi:hypothetical protein
MSHLRTVPSGPSSGIDAQDVLHARMTQVRALLSVLSQAYAEAEFEPTNEILREAIWGIEELHSQGVAALRAVMKHD